MWRRGCIISCAASFTIPGEILSIPGDFDRFREDITFKTSPFVAGLKTNFISFGLMSFPFQEILADVASYTFGRVARRAAATFVKNVLKLLAISFCHW